MACHNLETYQMQTRMWRDIRVQLCKIAVGDLVLNNKHNTENLRKLIEKWVGPFSGQNKKPQMTLSR